MMTRDELEDFLEEAISDSLEMDWRPRDGARSILSALEAAGCQIVQGEPVGWKYSRSSGMVRDYIAVERLAASVRAGFDIETPLYAGKVQP